MKLVARFDPPVPEDKVQRRELTVVDGEGNATIYVIPPEVTTLNFEMEDSATPDKHGEAYLIDYNEVNVASPPSDITSFPLSPPTETPGPRKPGAPTIEILKEEKFPPHTSVKVVRMQKG